MIRVEFWIEPYREWTDEERDYFKSHSEEIVRHNFASRIPQRHWTKGEQKAYEVIERRENYGMTFLEWSDFVETHTGDEVNEHIDNYYKSIGKERRKFKPIGKGILYDNVQHQNELGKRVEHNETNIFR